MGAKIAHVLIPSILGALFLFSFVMYTNAKMKTIVQPVAKPIKMTIKGVAIANKVLKSDEVKGAKDMVREQSQGARQQGTGVNDFNDYCTALLSPCECTNSTCCGAVSGGMFLNCQHLYLIFWYGTVLVDKQLCQNKKCGESACFVVTLLSKDGKVKNQTEECCSGSEFSSVNCGQNINCQQSAEDGGHTACCNPACARTS